MWTGFEITQSFGDLKIYLMFEDELVEPHTYWATWHLSHLVFPLITAQYELTWCSYYLIRSLLGTDSK